MRDKHHWVSTKHDADKKESGCFARNTSKSVVSTCGGNAKTAGAELWTVLFLCIRLFLHSFNYTHWKWRCKRPSQWVPVPPSLHVFPCMWHVTCRWQWTTEHLRARKQPPLTQARDFWHVAQVGRKLPIYNVSTQWNRKEEPLSCMFTKTESFPRERLKLIIWRAVAVSRKQSPNSILCRHVAQAIIIITRPEQIQNITDSCKAGLYFVLCVCPFIWLRWQGLRAATADYQPLTSGHRILYESYLTRPQPSLAPRSWMAEPWRNHGKCSHIVPAPPMTSRLHPGHFLVAFYIGSFSRGDEQTFTSCIVAALLLHHRHRTIQWLLHLTVLQCLQRCPMSINIHNKFALL